MSKCPNCGGKTPVPEEIAELQEDLHGFAAPSHNFTGIYFLIRAGTVVYVGKSLNSLR